jgi:predicted nucleic acid-binding protein
MILSDSNVLASFAAADQLLILWRLFNVATIWIPPGVEAEIEHGVARGRTHLAAIQPLLDSGNLQVLTLTSEDHERMATFPASLGIGEREAIAFCIRTRARLLCNDRRAASFCREQGVQYHDLITILRHLWTKGILSRAEVRALMTDMERVEHHVFKDPQIIFAPSSHPRHKQ